jgi:transcriptional regulator of heat shock response
MENMLTQRQQKMIQAIIDTYIEAAEPVSSKFLERKHFSDISSATIRSEMNELEQMGMLAQLHTSGGRVPTDRAYRFYVDGILARNDFSLPQKIKVRITQDINKTGPEPRSINQTAAKLVSELSDNLAIANTLESDDFFKHGLASLFESPEFRQLDTIFRITDIFEHFDRVFSQMEREFFRNYRQQSVQVIIGRENPVNNIRNETVILARYDLPQNQTGSLTVIGPMRMDYRRNISLINHVINEINNKSNNDHRTKTKRT